MVARHLAVVGEGERLEAWRRALAEAGHQVLAIAPPLPLTTLHEALAGVEGVFEVGDKPMPVRVERLRALGRAVPSEAFVVCAQCERTATELQALSGTPLVVVGDWAAPSAAPLLEVAVAEGLDAARKERALAVLGSLGQGVEVVQDQVGLVFARTLAMLVNEAAFALQEGVASQEAIDTAMRLGANYPEGPLAWADRLGAARVVAVLEGLERELGGERYRVAPLLRRKALAGTSFGETGSEI